jgi:hypothetical protein
MSIIAMNPYKKIAKLTTESGQEIPLENGIVFHVDGIGYSSSGFLVTLSLKPKEYKQLVNDEEQSEDTPPVR